MHSQPVRLQKYLSDCGVGSRRACEVLISQGKVTVDGVPVTGQGFKVIPSEQVVCVENRRVQPEETHHLLLYKPAGYICTSHDESGRSTIHELLPDLGARLYNVGRLDRASEGLLIVTNDGNLAARLTHPRYHVQKKYLVWVNKRLTPENLEQMKRGIQSGPDWLTAAEAVPHHGGRDVFCYEITLTEGKNRQIRRMFDAFDCIILRLLRTSIGPLEIGTLQPGQWRRLTPHEIIRLLPGGAE